MTLSLNCLFSNWIVMSILTEWGHGLSQSYIKPLNNFKCSHIQISGVQRFTHTYFSDHITVFFLFKQLIFRRSLRSPSRAMCEKFNEWLFCDHKLFHRFFPKIWLLRYLVLRCQYYAYGLFCLEKGYQSSFRFHNIV